MDSNAHSNTSSNEGDTSGNYSNTYSNNSSTQPDPSNNSHADPNVQIVTNVYEDQVTMDSEVITQVQFDASGTNIEIHESLTQVESIYDDEVPSSANTNLLDEIKLYASEIQCSDFHGKGTVDDYTALFNAASKIANDVKQMQMDVDVDGFNEFGQAADELSSLFTSFIARLQNVSIIDDSVFLQSIATALRKIVNLSKVFGKFKETILATSTIKIPKSVQDA